eukprot:PhF_6_TR15427/c0_g1_i2/m.23934
MTTPCIGDRVTAMVSGMREPGVVHYIGPLEGSTGTWVGIELDHPRGKHDGIVKGHRYFQCKKPLTGVMVSQVAVSVVSRGSTTVTPSKANDPQNTTKPRVRSATPNSTTSLSRPRLDVGKPVSLNPRGAVTPRVASTTPNTTHSMSKVRESNAPPAYSNVLDAYKKQPSVTGRSTVAKLNQERHVDPAMSSNTPKTHLPATTTTTPKKFSFKDKLSSPPTSEPKPEKRDLTNNALEDQGPAILIAAPIGRAAAFSDNEPAVITPSQPVPPATTTPKKFSFKDKLSSPPTSEPKPEKRDLTNNALEDQGPAILI